MPAPESSIGNFRLLFYRCFVLQLVTGELLHIVHNPVLSAKARLRELSGRLSQTAFSVWTISG